jgi:argininosuccinate lyase
MMIQTENLRESVERSLRIVETDEQAARVLVQFRQAHEMFMAANAQMDKSINTLADYRAALARQRNDDAASALDDADDMIDDVQDHTQAAAGGFSRLLGLVGGFVAGWKMVK